MVDFWAEWCQPCKRLGPLLEQLTEEARGNFRLARVDVDANPNLALRYSVRSIPTVKAFSQGQVVAEFAGLQPEPRVREFLGKLLPPSEVSLQIEKANSLLETHQWSARRTHLPLSRRHKILTSRRSPRPGEKLWRRQRAARRCLSTRNSRQ